MIGIVIPAHNEEITLGSCLESVNSSMRHPDLHGETVEVLVVLDSCNDASADVAGRAGVATLSLAARNVGVARAVGAEALLNRGARWLAFTDADTVVSSNWLVDQLSLGSDAVCGTVGVDDWSPHGPYANLLHWHFLQTYSDRDGHRHIHGANMGVSADAYRRAGGFQPLACSEDHALVTALEATGARIAWSAKPRVLTSARRVGRAQGGFADALVNAVAQRLALHAVPEEVLSGEGVKF